MKGEINKTLKISLKEKDVDTLFSILCSIEEMVDYFEENCDFGYPEFSKEENGFLEEIDNLVNEFKNAEY